MELNAEQLARGTNATVHDAMAFCDDLNPAMAQFRINTPMRVAAFLATLAIESNHLTATEESLYYRDAERLADIYPRAFNSAAAATPYVKNPQALGKLLYQGYWGRGLIQITWLKNYQLATAALGFDYVNFPELVKEAKHASLTAAWFFATNGCNEAADGGDITSVRRKVNGPKMMHLAEVTQQFNSNVTWL